MAPARMSDIKEIRNRSAGRDYCIIESLEAGIELKGTEVKSLRGGKANLSDSFARVENGEAWLHNFHISPYEQGNRENHDPKRIRRLLLHRTEILKLKTETSVSGHALIPLKGYFKKKNFKILLGVCKGKASKDKREDMKKRDAEREIRRAMAKTIRG
jgi:SsrA-binding protein